MGHRHMFCTSQFSEMDNVRNWIYQQPDPRLNTENGSFVETVAISGATSMAIPNYVATNSGLSHETYLHPPSAGSSSRVPPNYVQLGPPCYDQFAIGGVSSSANPQMDYGRATFKRKIPAFSMAFDSGSTSGHDIASSSNLHASSYHFQPEPMSCPRCWPGDPISMEPSNGSNTLLIPGDGSQRNVRSRHIQALHFETNSSGAHPSTNLPVRIPGLAVAGQWGHTPVPVDSHRRIPSSDIACFSREMNGGYNSNPNNCIEINGGYHSNPILTRNPSTSLPTLHGTFTQGTGLGQVSYGQRTPPYRPTPSYRSVGFTASMEDGRPTGLGAVVPLRHSWPLPFVGRSSDMVGRARNIYGQFQSFSEGVTMIDRSTFYGSESLFDQDHDMGLDIDNMSYEELLALGERIGTVSTGLSEGTVSKCLMEMIYCSDENQDDDDDEGNCVICMEEYKDRDGLGRLKCGHDFHSSCIKKWLLIKNVCPICKASALDDAAREKQTVSPS